MNTYPSENIPKNCRGRTPKLILRGHYHSDTNIKDSPPYPACTHTHTQNYRLISLMNRCKNPQQNTRKLNQKYIKMIIHHDQVGFILRIQGFFNILKSISMTHHINKPRNKHHMIISINGEKPFDKIQHPFVIKTQ